MHYGKSMALAENLRETPSNTSPNLVNQHFPPKKVWGGTWYTRYILSMFIHFYSFKQNTHVAMSPRAACKWRTRNEAPRRGLRNLSIDGPDSIPVNLSGWCIKQWWNLIMRSPKRKLEIDEYTVWSDILFSIVCSSLHSNLFSCFYLGYHHPRWDFPETTNLR